MLQLGVLHAFLYISPQSETPMHWYIPRQGPAVKNRTEQGSVCGHAFHRTIYG